MKKYNANAVGYKNSIDQMTRIFDAVGLPYTTNPAHDGFQIRFPWVSGDVVCHSGSYGHSKEYVESLGFPWDERAGSDSINVLRPERMAKRIANHWLLEFK